jgi:imidazolonepropionase-like amidohydrolase
MRPTLILLTGALLSGLLAPAAPAQTTAVIIENARVVPVSAPPIEHGSVLIVDGKIAGVGASVQAPAGARHLDAAGMTVYPGMIDSWTEIGLLEVQSVSATRDTTEIGDFNPQLFAFDAFYAHSEYIATARVAGITTVVSAPGGGLLSGQPVLVDMAGISIEDMARRRSVGLVFNFPQTRLDGFFDTSTMSFRRVPEAEQRKERERKLDAVRSLIRDAVAYASAIDARAGDATLPPMRLDLRLEALRPFVRGEAPFLMQIGDLRDVKPALDFADEFKLKAVVVIGGRTSVGDAVEAVKLLASKQVPVIVTNLYSLPRYEDERYDAPQQIPEMLRRAGVRFALASSGTAMVRDLPYQAAMAVAYGGLSKADAVRALTLWPAEIWGVGDRIGSIEVGKDANLVVATGDILEVRTDVRHVFIRGVDVPIESKQTRLYEQFRKR